MADDQVRTSSKVARGTPKMEVIVTLWYVNCNNIWCCCSLSKVVVLSRITTTNCSTVLILVPTAYLTFPSVDSSFAESLPRQSRKNSEDDSRVNNNIFARHLDSCQTLSIASLVPWLWKALRTINETAQCHSWGARLRNPQGPDQNLLSAGLCCFHGHGPGSCGRLDLRLWSSFRQQRWLFATGDGDHVPAYCIQCCCC